MLRGSHAPIVVMTHRHSALALRLRADLLDTEIRFEARLASMQSWAAIHGRQDCDLTKVAESLGKIYFDALDVIPYLTGGTSASGIAKAEADALAEQYRQWEAMQAKHKGVKA